MDIEEIRKNAPDGATHYDVNFRYYMMNQHDYLVYKWCGFGWLLQLNPVDLKPL